MNKISSLVTQNTFWKYSAFIILPFILILIDVFFRYEYLLLMESKGYINYTLSIFYELLLSFVLIKTLEISGRFKQFGIILIAFIISLLVIGVYGHHNYFGVLPNSYSLGYIIDHFDDTSALVSGSIGISHPVIFLSLFALFSLIFKISISSVKSYSKKVSVTLLIAFIMMTLFLNNNVRFLPSSYTFSASTLFTFKYFIQDRLFGQQTEMEQGYYARKVNLESREKGVADFNLILIIGESSRKDRFGYYGFNKDTSPFIDSLIKSGNVVLFKNHVSNTVSTQYSLPIILSGVYALEKHHIPYVYDHIKSRFRINTFFFSSQSMKKDGIDLVFNTSMDTFVCQENSGYGVFNDRGVDDFDIQKSMFRYLEKIQSHAINSKKKDAKQESESSGLFFGIVNLNNSHYPYKLSKGINEKIVNSDPKPPLRVGNMVSLNDKDRYNNTIYEIDVWMQNLFSYLKSKNMLSNTIVVFTSDHGEAFGEHNHNGHLQTLYNEDIDVPLWFYIPDSLKDRASGEILSNSGKYNSHLDLTPTILDFYGIYNDSLKLCGNSFLRNNSGYAVPLLSKDMIDSKGIIKDSLKLLVTIKDGREISEIYNLLSDPKESKNLWESISDHKKNELLKVLSDFEKKRKRLDKSK